MKWIIAWLDHDNNDLSVEEFTTEKAARKALSGRLSDYKCVLIEGEIHEVAT